jgi:N-acetylglutamate synthase-like GNAT family acetyltransferase
MFIIKRVKHKVTINLLIKNKIIGGVNCFISNKTSILNTIYIDNKFRNMGYGSKLLNKTETVLRTMNVEEINLTAWSPTHMDSLNEFYYKHNFIESSSRNEINFIDNYEDIYYLTNFTKNIKN